MLRRPLVHALLFSQAGLLAACGSSESSGSLRPDATADTGAPDAAVDASDADALDGSAAAKILSESAGSSWEAEAHLVVAAGGRTVAVWMSLAGSALKNGFAISEDRGSTWSPAQAMDGVKTLGDPVLAARADGSFFYGYLDGTCSAGGCAGGRVWIARMAPGASAFSDAVDVSPADPLEFYDKPWLLTAADDSLVAIFNGRIGSYPTNVDTIVAARSTDGVSWTRSYVVPKQPEGQIAGIPHACGSRSAPRLWTVYVDLASPVYASLRWSDDHGASWPTDNVSSGFALPAQASTLQAYDLRCVGEGDDVWVMYGLATGASSATSIPALDELHVARSTDGGKTWSERGLITRPATRFLRPEIALDGAGRLHVVTYAGQAEGDADGAVRHFRSSDGGKSFVEQAVVFAPILFTGERGGGNTWIGDYSGLAVDQSDLFAAYVDNSSGRSQIAFRRMAIE